MVSTMASAYSGLSEEERDSVFLLAVGKNDYTNKAQKFCQGFASCADDGDASWWTAWDVAQRDVFFYMKTDPDDDSSWEFYCKYSMNIGRNEFGDTIRTMLSIATANEVEAEILEDDLAGSESQSLDPSEVLSDPSPSDTSSSSLISTSMSCFMMSIVLALSIV